MTGVEDDGTRFPLDDRGLSFDDDVVDLVFRRQHPNSANIANIIEVTYRLIANKRATDHHSAGISWNDKVASLITQSAADERGIGWTE